MELGCEVLHIIIVKVLSTRSFFVKAQDERAGDEGAAEIAELDGEFLTVDLIQFISRSLSLLSTE